MIAITSTSQSTRREYVVEPHPNMSSRWVIVCPQADEFARSNGLPFCPVFFGVYKRRAWADRRAEQLTEIAEQQHAEMLRKIEERIAN